MKHLVIFLCIWIYSFDAFGQDSGETSISITPSFAWITESTPHGHFTVSNTGTRSVEITATVDFGVIASAGENNETGIFMGGEYPPMRNLTEHLSLFPPRMILASGESQTVRYMIPQAQILPSGGYISMVKFSMTQRAPIVEGQVSATSAGVQINYSLVAPLVLIQGEGQPQITVAPIYQGENFTGIMLENVGDFPYTGRIRISNMDKTQIYQEAVTSVFTQRFVSLSEMDDLPDTLRVMFVENERSANLATSRLVQPADVIVFK